VSEAEVDRLPDPDLFRDALFLHTQGVITPSELDGMDAALLALVRRFKSPRRSD
jgi:hypothetical protein